MRCEEVRRELSNYVEGELNATLHSRMDEHFRQCKHCRAVLDGTQNIMRLVGDDRAFDLPSGFSERLRQRLASPSIKEPRGRTIPLGIKGEHVSLGDHIAYFWETPREFEEAAGFLETGLRANDHCVVFGHEQANETILRLLRTRGFDLKGLIEERRLSVLGGHSSAEEMLRNIAADFQAALAAGAPLIRLLGNLGWGRQNWPVDDDILEFEAKVTGAAGNFPCVIVCMYDVCSLPGRIVLKGGFETHPVTMCGHVLRENPHYVPIEPFLARLRGETQSGSTGIVQ